MLDPHSRMPLYHQIESHLREVIRSGKWQAGEAIPPERLLIEQYGVSRITIRQALANLVAAGLLYRKHGRGTFVAGAKERPITESLANLTGHLEELQLRGLDPRVRVLALETRPMIAEVAEALQRSPGAEGWYLYRIVTVEQQPLMLSTVWLPCDLGVELNEVNTQSSRSVQPVLVSRFDDPASALSINFRKRRIGHEKTDGSSNRITDFRHSGRVGHGGGALQGAPAKAPEG